MTGENGAYELETIHPGRYQIAPGVWRPSHIHYLVRAPGYKTLVTQLYFNGDPMNAKDQFIKPSLIIALTSEKGDRGSYEHGIFDIVLAQG
jgi:protocatechuate 3,4-dioxygenase beta subunit